MDGQKEEAAMSPEKGSLLKRLARTGLTALGITTATAPGIAALNEAAQRTSPQHSTPVSPQEDPFNRQPPQGVTFSEGVRADAPVPDAPVEPVYSHKVLLPNVTNKAVETLTPEQQVERFIATTQVVDRVEQVRNNRTYSVETRVVPDAPLRITAKPELKNEVARLVAQDGEKNGFTKAEIVVTQPTDDIRAEIAPGVIVQSRTDIWDYNTQQYVPVGYWTVQQRNNSLTFFFAPGNNLPLDNPEFMERANRTIAGRFFRMTASGGDPLSNVLAGKTEYLDLISKTPFFFVSS